MGHGILLTYNYYALLSFVYTCEWCVEDVSQQVWCVLCNKNKYVGYMMLVVLKGGSSHRVSDERIIARPDEGVSTQLFQYILRASSTYLCWNYQNPFECLPMSKTQIPQSILTSSFLSLLPRNPLNFLSWPAIKK